MFAASILNRRSSRDHECGITKCKELLLVTKMKQQCILLKKMESVGNHEIYCHGAIENESKHAKASVAHPGVHVATNGGGDSSDNRVSGHAQT